MASLANQNENPGDQRQNARHQTQPNQRRNQRHEPDQNQINRQHLKSQPTRIAIAPSFVNSPLSLRALILRLSTFQRQLFHQDRRLHWERRSPGRPDQPHAFPVVRVPCRPGGRRSQSLPRHSQKTSHPAAAETNSRPPATPPQTQTPSKTVPISRTPDMPNNFCTTTMSTPYSSS